MEKGLLPLELGRLYQLGYVTTDLDEAMRYVSANFVVTDFIDFGRFKSKVSAGEADIRVAHGRMGDLVFELIQPLGGADAVYADYLPASGFAIRLHHAAYHLDDAAAWERLGAAIEARGLSVPIRGRSPSSQYVYLDLRSMLGHYAEVVHRTGGGAGLDVESERRRVEAAIAELRATSERLPEPTAKT